MQFWDKCIPLIEKIVDRKVVASNGLFEGIMNNGETIFDICVLLFWVLFVSYVANVLIAGEKQDQRFRTEGIRATAKVISIRETGSMAADNPVAYLEVEVYREDGVQPYVATFREMIPVIRVPSVQPGRTLHVLILPDDPNKIEVDWVKTP